MTLDLIQLRRGLNPTPATLVTASRAEAAVALVIRGIEGDHDPEILLVQRAAHPRDPWSGHMALPGGRWSGEDRSLLDTAIRETREETALDLSTRAGARFLGWLGHVSPRSVKIPRTRVSPAVFVAPPSGEARVASSELAGVHWTSLTQLVDPERRGTISLGANFDDDANAARSLAAVQMPCIHVEPGRVWGLTYRILADFFERCSVADR